MSKLDDLILDIQEDLVQTDMTPAEIAEKHSVPVEWVYEIEEHLTFL